MNTNKRTCVITGASRGIGRAITKELGQSGANVIVNYRSSESAAYDVAESIEENGGTAVPVQADVSDISQVKAMRDTVHGEFGSIDVLVNNAGITVDKTFTNMTEADWKQVIDVNLGGVFNCTKTFYEDIKKANEGRLINISSVIGKQGNYGQSNYAASKSGMLGFTRSIALELASSGSTANCVAPGYTRTDMVDDVPEDIQDKLRSKIPLNRFAEPEEIANVVRFLASEESSYMTGEVIDVNGAIDL
ncbi:3-oxoacyl-(acyl-carrier-protein) reductase [Halogeometricum borinquense DSM 11551]|uniref:3-oxoacyl-(Acyl-carrier-protein) reductase n=2 Tax=Halogeometricum borinquense TaxID=60847 RepID=E4NU19_HALBP|nr:3-oxoacyl-[acyl-carrier-protein] reductase [Halogeometricum borinquense]ADQ68539.1 3-oxoacyl-(acyl-carrier-protein) reductase [Halogeometricum borinquense DSM 11551]ELY25589.1 3-oxoacyl-(acyl-carrier-protein) reductase [Halogeometricum borinquense DSM 11551]RYJ08534.1 3-oxoacyl-[acyl-carrier-protein] reductase [Halogeometricum borinquense]